MNTEILVITDRSGSMGPLANDVIGGYNQFLTEQAALPGEARVTFTQFDNQYELLYQGKPVKDAPRLSHATYKPRGSTALYDALGRTLNEQGARISAEKWAELVVVCVITDGQENASREFSLETIQRMTKHAEDHGWKFVYLAANQSAFQATQHLGMAQAVSMTYAANSAGTAAAYDTMSATLRSMRAGDSIVGDVTGTAVQPAPGIPGTVR